MSKGMNVTRRQTIRLMAGAAGIIAAGGLTGCAPSTGGAKVAETGSSKEASFTPGTYEATVKSMGGPLTVAVTTSDTAIEAIEIVEMHDTDGVADAAIERIPQQILDNQSLGVDTVSGATMTSFCLTNAVAEALGQATDDIASLRADAPYEAPAQEDVAADVVVVGGGIAGLAAATRCAEAGKSVVVIERNGFVGGNALLSEGSVLSSFTSPIEENFHRVLEYLDAAGINYDELDLGADYGMEYNLENTEQRSGTAALTDLFVDRIQSNGGEILCDTTVTGLIVEDGTVVGVTAQPIGQGEFEALGGDVILATGGFVSNPDLVGELLPAYKGIQAGGLPGTQGDALTWIKDVDGQTIQLDSDGHFYCVNPDSGYRASSGSMSPLYVDGMGDRFCDTPHYSSVAKAAWLAFGEDTFYSILTKEQVEEGGYGYWMDHMIEAGTAIEYQSISEIGDAYGLTNLAKTVESEEYAYPETGTFYVSPAKSVLYGTYGGIRVNEKGQVMNNSNQPVEGLYAAGEVIGSPNFQENGLYIGQLGPSMTMAFIEADTVNA